MDVSRRRARPSKRRQALANINTELQTDNEKLERSNADLKTKCGLLEQQNKRLKIAVVLLLASSISVGVGMGAGMSRFSPGAALTLATTVFFAVITVSLAILNYMG